MMEINSVWLNFLATNILLKSCRAGLIQFPEILWTVFLIDILVSSQLKFRF